MYLNCRIKIPDTGGKITIKLVSGTSYVYLEQGRIYDKEKKYNVPKRICIGKQDPEQTAFMYPNEKFLVTVQSRRERCKKWLPKIQKEN